jgi:hypothetical protein
VALIDKYWESSTWKAHEFTYATGGAGNVNGAKGKPLSKRIALLLDCIELPSYIKGGSTSIVVIRSILELNDALEEAF